MLMAAYYTILLLDNLFPTKGRRSYTPGSRRSLHARIEKLDQYLQIQTTALFFYRALLAKVGDTAPGQESVLPYGTSALLASS